MEILQSLGIDWTTLLGTIVTAVVIPIGLEIQKWIKEKTKGTKVENYTNMLMTSAEKVVKEVYQTVVDQIKGTDEWTDAKKAEVLEVAKNKIILSLSTEGYEFLKSINTDFDEWITTIIESYLWDLKNQKVGE